MTKFHINFKKREGTAAFFIGMACLLWADGGSNQCIASEENALTSFSGIGQGFVTQSFGIAGHFPPTDEVAGNPFLERKGDEVEIGANKKQRTSPLTWNLGFGYSFLSSPATKIDPQVNDDELSGQLGFGWEISSRVMTRLEVGVDAFPEETVRHGWATVRFEYLVSLGGGKSKRHVEEDAEAADESTDSNNSNDASSYYQKQREKRMKEVEKKWKLELANSNEAEEEDKRIRNTYPQLKLSYILGFNSDSIQAKLARVPSKASVPSQSMTMNQYQYGPEIAYSPKAGRPIRWR